MEGTDETETNMKGKQQLQIQETKGMMREGQMRSSALEEQVN